jgi:glycosyltransferase involved in cell wall biosynthesis
MKILHVNITSSGGGIEEYLLRLSEELERRGHESLLLHGENAAGPSLPMKARIYPIEGITRPVCRDLSDKLVTVTAILGRERPDLVFFHQVLNPRLVDFLSRRYPSLQFAHGFKTICPDGRKTLKSNGVFCEFPLSYLCQVRAYRYKCMPRNVFKGLPAISGSKRIAKIHKEKSLTVVASQFMKKVMLCNGYDEERIAVIPPFTSLPDLASLDSVDDPPLIISVGRVVREKGMDYLLQAFASLKQKAKIVIIGDGPFLNELKSLAQQLGILSNVSFPGWLPPNELKLYYRKCSMAVVPSTWPEPFGMVGIEAMSYGKPVLAFDVGGIPEWLKHEETGFLVKPKDTVALAERISFLLERPELARSIGNKGREAVAIRFVPSAHVDQLLPVFHQAIDFFKKNPNLGSRSKSKQ